MMTNEKGSWTDNQRKLLFAQIDKNNLSKEEMEAGLGFPMSELSKVEASVLIDYIMHGDLDDAISKVKEMHTSQEEQSQETKAITPVTPQKQEIAQEKPKFVAEPGSELAIAKIAGLPPEMANLFFMKLNDNAYIKVAGLQYMAGKIGYRRIEITDHFDEKSQTWIAEAKIYPKISIEMVRALSSLTPEVQKQMYDELSKPTNGIGTANKDNVKTDKMWKFLREMAQTRALGRALRSYTGYGSTTYEELPDAEVEVE